jgi:hypothetical protein
MNQPTHMILVDGVPFSGKSTTSEYIATQLELNRYPAHWVPEGMMLQHYFPHVLAVLKRQQIDGNHQSTPYPPKVTFYNVRYAA